MNAVLLSAALGGAGQRSSSRQARAFLWDDDRCHTILSNLAAAMRQDSRLLMVEFLQEPHRPHPMVPLVDLQMLTQADGGRERSVAEFRALLEGAGLVLGRVHRGPMHAVLEASTA